MANVKDFIAKYGDIRLLDGKHYKGDLWLHDNQLTEVSGHIAYQPHRTEHIPMGVARQNIHQSRRHLPAAHRAKRKCMPC